MATYFATNLGLILIPAFPATKLAVSRKKMAITDSTKFDPQKRTSTHP
jgi:hypothetical protein